MTERWVPMPSFIYKHSPYCLTCALTVFDTELVVTATHGGYASLSAPGQKTVTIHCIYEPGGAWCCRCEQQLSHMVYTVREK